MWRFTGNAILTFITKIGSGYWHIMDPQNGYTAISRPRLETIDLDAIYPYYGYCNDMLIKLNTFWNDSVGRDDACSIWYREVQDQIRQVYYESRSDDLQGISLETKNKVCDSGFPSACIFLFGKYGACASRSTFNIWIFIEKWYQIPVSPNFPLLAVFITLIGLQFPFICHAL